MPFFTQFFIISADYSFCKFFLITRRGLYQYVGALTQKRPLVRAQIIDKSE